MLKYNFTLILTVLLFQNVWAQPKKDTIVYFMKEPEWVVDNKNEAEFVRYVMPADSSSGIKVYPVFEYYANGNRKLVGATTRTTQHLHLEGGVTRFYPNGKRKSYENYHDSWPSGEFIRYYPNGKVYTVCIFDADRHLQQFKECRDSTGKVLAENGNGEWITFDSDFTHALEQGTVKNGLYDGDWRGTANDSIKYVYKYSKGRLKSGTSFDRSGHSYPFIEPSIPAEYKTGPDGFSDFLKRNLHYPDYERQVNTDGMVRVSFMVERDGSLTNFKVVRSVSDKLDSEALRVIKLTQPWKPARIYGIPARSLVTVPVVFVLLPATTKP